MCRHGSSFRPGDARLRDACTFRSQTGVRTPSADEYATQTDDSTPNRGKLGGGICCWIYWGSIDKGLFGLDKEIFSNSVLIPGLKLKVDGTTDDQGRVVAKTITVDGDDLETAQMIQSGLHPTAEQVSANMQAIEANRQGVAANKVQLAAQKESIETNQQNIAANRQQIEENIKASTAP
jgi:hypothetical protein